MAEERRLLVVDDEVTLLKLMGRYLSRLGHAVETAAAAESALSLFSKEPDRYLAVIVDLTLPDLPGDELLAKLRALRPDLPAVICSGTIPEDLSWADDPPTIFLQKPFLPKMLIEALDRVLVR